MQLFISGEKKEERKGCRILHEPYFYLYGTFCKEIERRKKSKQNEMKNKKKKFRIQ